MISAPCHNVVSDRVVTFADHTKLLCEHPQARRHSRTPEQNDIDTEENNCSWLCKYICSLPPRGSHVEPFSERFNEYTYTTSCLLNVRGTRNTSANLHQRQNSKWLKRLRLCWCMDRGICYTEGRGIPQLPLIQSKPNAAALFPECFTVSHSAYATNLQVERFKQNLINPQ